MIRPSEVNTDRSTYGNEWSTPEKVRSMPLSSNQIGTTVTTSSCSWRRVIPAEESGQESGVTVRSSLILELLRLPGTLCTLEYVLDEVLHRTCCTGTPCTTSTYRNQYVYYEVD